MGYCFDCGAKVGQAPASRCPACGREHWHNPRPCAGVLLSCEGRLLLVRRARDPWRGRWDIPGGFVEHGELPLRSALRELREETGREIASASFFGIWNDPAPDPRYGDCLCIYYWAQVEAPEAAAWAERFVANDEVSEIRWFSAGEMPADLASPAHIPEVIEAWRTRVAAGGGS